MRVILVHGFNANPQMNFHPWLADALRAKGFIVETPTLNLSTKDEFHLPDIIESMKDQVGYLDNDDIILGHSLGAFIVLQYLEAVEMTETPRAVVLVAPPWKVSNPELKRLFIADLDADVLMWKAQEYVVVHSKDDKLVPFEHGQKLANVLRARLVEADGDDHYMGAEYPLLLKVVEDISKTPIVFEPGVGLNDDLAEVANI